MRGEYVAHLVAVASHDHAAEARWQDFDRAAPRERIGLLRRDGGRAPELEERMAEAVTEASQCPDARSRIP